MSLLLEALRKADRERKNADAPAGLDAAPSLAPASHSRRNGLLWLLALLVCVLAAILIGLLLRTAPSGDLSEAAVPAPVGTDPAPAVSSVAVSSSSAAATVPQTAVPPASAAEITHHPDGTLSMVGEPYSESLADKSPAEATDVVRPAAASAPNKAEVLALYQQVAKAQQAETSQTETSQPESPPAAQVAPPSEFGQLGGVRSLPLATQNAVPTLMYSAHNYHPDGKSSVIINRRLRYEGDQVADGVTLESIEPEGVILRMGSHRFTLRAKVSWVNM